MSDPDDLFDPSIRTRVTITNRRGLHARAAAKFVKTAELFNAHVKVCRVEGTEMCNAGETVSGRSIMGLMMLAASPGSVLEIKSSGEDAAAAVEALAKLVEAKFDED
jgi:phosphocarrier protein